VGCTCAQAAARAPTPAGSHRRQPAPGAGASGGGGAAAGCLPRAGSGAVPAGAGGSTCALAPLPPNGAGAGSGAAGACGAGAELGSCCAPRSVFTQVCSVGTGGRCTRESAAAHYVFLVPLALQTLDDGSFVALRHLDSGKVAAPALVGLKVERPARRACIGISLNSRQTWLAVHRRGIQAARPSSTAAPAAGAHSNGLSAAMLRLPAATTLFSCQVAARTWRCELATGREEGRRQAEGLSNPGGNTHGLAATPSTLRDDGQPEPPLLISVCVQQPVALAGTAARQQRCRKRGCPRGSRPASRTATPIASSARTRAATAASRSCGGSRCITGPRRTCAAAGRSGATAASCNSAPSAARSSRPASIMWAATRAARRRGTTRPSG